MKKIITITILVAASILIVSCDLFSIVVEPLKDDARDVFKEATEYQYVEGVELNVNACYFDNMTTFIQVKDFSIFEARRMRFEEEFSFVEEKCNTEMWMWEKVNLSGEYISEYYGNECTLVLFDEQGRVVSIIVTRDYPYVQEQFMFDYCSDEECTLIEFSRDEYDERNIYNEHKGIPYDNRIESSGSLNSEKALFVDKLGKVVKAVEMIEDSCSNLEGIEHFIKAVRNTHDLMTVSSSPSTVDEKIISLHRVASELVSRNYGGFKMWAQERVTYYLDWSRFLFGNIEVKEFEIENLANKKIRLNYSFSGFNDQKYEFHRSIAWVNMQNKDSYGEVVIPKAIKDGNHSDVIELERKAGDYKIVLFVYPTSLLTCCPIVLENSIRF